MAKRKVKTEGTTTPAVVAATTEKPKKAPRFTHGISTKYAGPSKGTNQRKSRTVIPVSEFGSKKDMVLTERTQAILTPMRAKYGNKPFQRGDLDAGVLKFAIWKGHVNVISGDGTSEGDTYSFTKDGLANK